MPNPANVRSSLWLAVAIALAPVAAAPQDAKPPGAKASETKAPEVKAPSKVVVSRGMAETALTREVFTANEARIAAMNWVNADCTSGPLPDLRIATPPQNGELRMEEITMPIDRPKDTPRFSCNGKPVKAVAVFYKSKAGYTGDDNAVIDVDFKTGQVRRFSYKITVR